MNKTRVHNALKKAEQICSEKGVRLTAKRREILEVLLRSQTPLSAYEVVDAYNEGADQSMPAMSAYRILEFLLARNLAHKLNSTGKYVACSHISCAHEHEIPQFLICRGCQKVTEVGIHAQVIAILRESVETVGFHLVKSQLELDCVCDICWKKGKPALS